MSRSPQPLFDALNLPRQDGSDILVKNSEVHQVESGERGTSLHTQSIAAPQSNNPLDHDSSDTLKNTNVKTLHSTGQDLKQDEVSLRREKFSTTGRSERLESNNMTENLKATECKSSSNSQMLEANKSSHAPNSKCMNEVQNSTHGATTNQVITNGGSLRSDSRFDSDDSAYGADESYLPGDEVKTLGHDSDLRRHHQHYPLRQAHSEVIPSSAMQRRQSLVTVKERGYARLEDELMRAQKALERKDQEVDELKGIRERLMKEVSDFTAALFEEVNSQLNEAALSEQLAKRQLKEADAKIEVLTAEVAALKDLVLTSTPSSPNRHLNPQIDTPVKKDKGGKPFWKTHKRSTSHHQFTKDSREMAEATEQHSLLKELDTVVFDEFIRWRLQPTNEFQGQFFNRVQQEDIQPCLSFRNTRLADKLLSSVRSNTLSIEPIPGDQSFPRKCCLSECHKLCNYRIRFEDDDEWYPISQMSRNRIASVCDFYAYLRYIVQGLVKCSDKDIFAELVRLRNQMAQARLGLI